MTFRGPFRAQIESCLPSVLECSHYVVSAVFFGKSKERFDKATHSFTLSLFFYVFSDDTLMELSNCELVSSFRQIEQGVHYIRKFLIFSTNNVFLEKVVVT